MILRWYRFPWSCAHLTNHDHNHHNRRHCRPRHQSKYKFFYQLCFIHFFPFSDEVGRDWLCGHRVGLFICANATVLEEKVITAEDNSCGRFVVIKPSAASVLDELLMSPPSSPWMSSNVVLARICICICICPRWVVNVPPWMSSEVVHICVPNTQI